MRACTGCIQEGGDYDGDNANLNAYAPIVSALEEKWRKMGNELKLKTQCRNCIGVIFGQSRGSICIPAIYVAADMAAQHSAHKSWNTSI